MHETINRYRLHQQLMAHWKSLFPEMIYTVNFEQLVENPEAEIKSVLESCELPYEESCIDHVKDAINRNRFPTPENAIDTWKPFESYLKPIFDRHIE